MAKINSHVLSDQQALISICIPTFNRATCLTNLLVNLKELKGEYGNEIEICISNNHSTDGTAEILKSWLSKLDLKVVTQSENIGATLNCLAATREATGKWVILIGDDDEFILENFGKLLVFLRTVDEDDWILVGVAGPSGASGGEQLLGNLVSGKYESESFRRILLRTGLYRYGFIGMHVFPSTLKSRFCSLSDEQVQSWPHLALLLTHLYGNYFHVFSEPVVAQAAGGAALFFKAGDFVHINLRKMDVIHTAIKSKNDFRWFGYFLLLRELYSLRNAKSAVIWKILEPQEFRRKAFSEYIGRYILCGPLAFIAAGHCIFLLLLYIVPSFLLYGFLHILGKKDVLTGHILTENSNKDFDGVDRGL